MLPVATAGLIATSPAQPFGFAPFNPAVREALGLSHSAITGAYMLGTLLASIPLTYVGAAMDRFGPRRTMTVVVFLLFLTPAIIDKIDALREAGVNLDDRTRMPPERKALGTLHRVYAVLDGAKLIAGVVLFWLLATRKRR